MCTVRYASSAGASFTRTRSSRRPYPPPPSSHRGLRALTHSQAARGRHEVSGLTRIPSSSRRCSPLIGRDHERRRERRAGHSEHEPAPTSRAGTNERARVTAHHAPPVAGQTWMASGRGRTCRPCRFGDGFVDVGVSGGCFSASIARQPAQSDWHSRMRHLLSSHAFERLGGRSRELSMSSPRRPQTTRHLHTGGLALRDGAPPHTRAASEFRSVSPASLGRPAQMLVRSTSRDLSWPLTVWKSPCGTARRKRPAG